MKGEINLLAKLFFCVYLSSVSALPATDRLYKGKHVNFHILFYV